MNRVLGPLARDPAPKLILAALAASWAAAILCGGAMWAVTWAATLAALIAGTAMAGSGRGEATRG